MLNRWTYGWLGQPATEPQPRSPLNSPPSPSLSFTTALNYDGGKEELPGGWVETWRRQSDQNREGGAIRFGSSPQQRQQFSQLHSSQQKSTRFEEIPSRPSSTRPAATVSPQTLSRLKTQLARKSTLPPNTTDPHIEKDFAAPRDTSLYDTRLGDDETYPPLLTRPHPLDPPHFHSTTPNPPPNSVHPTTSEPHLPSHRTHTTKPSWASEWDNLIEKEVRERLELQERLDSAAMERAGTIQESRLPEVPDKVAHEGTLLVPPSSFKSTVEISRLSYEYWIPYQAILSTKFLRFLVPSDFSSPESSNAAVSILDFADCEAIYKPQELNDRRKLFTFAVELKNGEKEYFATETAKDWMTWTVKIRECIDLANGRAPPTFENVDTTFVTQPLESSTLSRQRLQDHLDELQDISDLLERGEDPRDRSELLNEERKPNWRRRLRGRDGINAGFKTHWDSITQQTAEQERNDHHQNRDSARGDSPRRLQKPSRRPKVDMTGVDTAAILKGPEVDQDTSGKREERKRHRNRAPNPRELLRMFKEQQGHLEQSRQFQRDQSKALASLVKDLHSNQSMLQDSIPSLHHALTTIKEAQQAQAETVNSLTRRFETEQTQKPPLPPNPSTLRETQHVQTRVVQPKLTKQRPPSPSRSRAVVKNLAETARLAERKNPLHFDNS